MQYRYPEEKEKYKIVIDGDGTQSLTFMYMQNATKLIKHIVDTPDIKWDSDVYNVCPDIIDLISLKEVVDLLKIGFQTDLDVVYTNSFKNGDIHISYGDNTKAKEKLGFTYTYTFKNIFKRLINESKTSIIKQMDQQPF
jgi:nucleoside-diphosphate-sugar epimerase